MSSLHPTLRKSAKDGAPEVLWLVERGRVGYPAVFQVGVIGSGYARH